MAEVFISIAPTGYTLSGAEQARYGASHRYTSMTSMEAGEDVDWVTATDKPTVEIIGGDGSTNWGTVGADTSQARFTGWTLSTALFLTMKTIGTAVPDFVGGIDTTAYRLAVADDRCLYLINSSDFFVYVEGLQIIETGTTGFRPVIDITGNGGTFEFKNCYIEDGSSDNRCGQIDTTNAGTFRFWNCILVDGAGFRARDDASEFYHCTINRGSVGLESDNADVTVKNCAVFNNTNDFLDTFTTIDFCASDDVDGTNRVALNENASGEWDDSFTDYANDDYTVKDASSLLYDAGTSLQGGSAPFTDLTGDTDPLSTDILGNARTTDDIGAFVFVSGGISIDAFAVDGIDFSDNSSRTKIIDAVCSDVLSLSDSDSNNANLLAGGVDGIKFSDISALTALLNVSAIDGIKLSDNSTLTAILNAFSVDGIKFSDSSLGSLFLVIEALASDGIKFSDISNVSTALFSLASDGIIFSDSSEKPIATFNVLAEDGIKLSDVATTIRNLIASAIDGIKLSDIAIETSFLATGEVKVSMKTKIGKIDFIIKQAGIDIKQKNSKIDIH